MRKIKQSGKLLFTVGSFLMSAALNNAAAQNPGSVSPAPVLWFKAVK
jgi:hypothetical protein